jgi:hypothetical protein
MRPPIRGLGRLLYLPANARYRLLKFSINILPWNLRN